MTVKNFVFKESLAANEWTGMKLTFFAIFDPTWIHIFTPKGLTMEFFNQNFNFPYIRKTEAMVLPTMSL